ncbi:MAG: Lrp/AsnC family transcriptional regulator [Candidatus Geothermarchaeales archaeon]
MDRIELGIIKELKEDARTSFRKIADKLGVSPDTVINRYKVLKERGTIRGSTVVIDPRKIGYEGMVVFMIVSEPTYVFGTDTTPADSQQILNKLIEMRSIILATKTVGDHDLMAIGVAKNFEHLNEMSTQISNIQGVVDLQISFWTQNMELRPEYFII